jgi:thymidylate kinase
MVALPDTAPGSTGPSGDGLRVTPAGRAAARIAAGETPSAPPEGWSAAELTKWYQRNKYPVLAFGPGAPSWLTGDESFREARAAEQAWYDTQRQEYLLARQAWLDRGVECLMIKSAGNAPSFPHTSDNIDILVRPEHGLVARDTLRRLGYAELRNIEEPQKHLFRKFHDGRCVSAIHVHERVAWFVGFMDEAALWARMRPADDDPMVNLPSPEDAVLINLAHACYENKRLRLNDVMRIRHVVRTANGQLDWAYMERVAASRGWLDGLAFLLLLYAELEASLFGASLIAPSQQERLEWILERAPFAARRRQELRHGPAIDLPLDLSYVFCKKLYYRKILSDPVQTGRQRWRDVGLTLMWGIKLKSGVRPQPGMVVSISGPDGSGKTAHAQALVEALRLSEIKTDYFWNRGGSTGLVGLANRLRRGLGAKATARSDDSITSRRRRMNSPLARFAWSWLVAADQVGTYLLRAWLPARLGRVVVADRYVYDTAVEMDASLPAEARWSRLAIAAMLGLVPRPDVAYVLEVKPETAQARKPDEVFHLDLAAERWRYRALAHRRGLRLLSTEGAFADSNDRLIREVLTAYMGSFETLLNALFLANPSQKNVPDPVWASGGQR